VRNPKFKPQYHKEKKRKKEGRKEEISVLIQKPS
jgi:hypothetical protein